MCGPHFSVGELPEVCIFAAVMFIKPTKKWRNPEGDSSIMVPYTYYRLCESERDATGRPKQRTVLGLGELLEFPTQAEREELAELLTALIRDGECRLCSSQRLYDAALGFYGKWLDEKREAEERRDRQAEEARRRAEEAKEAKVCVKLKSLQPEMSRSVGAEHACSQTLERLGLQREIEDYLHKRVCDMFDLEDKILLFDLTNTYFEGRMDGSKLCRYGRCKSKRYDCKIVGLGAVVNTDGLLCRTQIFEGNRQDVTTLEEVIGSLEDKSDGKRHLIVIDAGFSSADNLAWLRENGYDYITVMRSTGFAYEEAGEVRSVSDNKGRSIRLQRVRDLEDTVLLVDSDAKALKERSMEAKLTKRYEEGLAKIKAGIDLEYDAKDVATTMSWRRKTPLRKCTANTSCRHRWTRAGESIWQFYNVIRTVEETFKTLKLDLDIRPVYHKTDSGAKAHLHLAILAYWVVSVTKYLLKQKGITLRWSELLRIMSAQQRVTITAQQSNGRKLNIRRSTNPEGKLSEIQNALGIPPKPTCFLKFVWPQKLPPRKDPGCLSATWRGIGCNVG